MLVCWEMCELILRCILLCPVLLLVVFCHWADPVFIDAICLSSVIFLAVNNPFCIFSSTSPVTYPLACQAFFFLSFALQLLSLVVNCGITHFSVFVSLLSSVSFVFLQVSVLCHFTVLLFIL